MLMLGLVGGFKNAISLSLRMLSVGWVGKSWKAKGAYKMLTVNTSRWAWILYDADKGGKWLVTSSYNLHFSVTLYSIAWKMVKKRLDLKVSAWLLYSLTILEVDGGRV